MKMPRRPWYPGQIPKDIFGLHQQTTILGRAGESEAEAKERIAVIEKGVRAAFKAAVAHLGEQESRELFARVLRRPKRGRGKALSPDRDWQLLKEYDAAVKTGESLAILAKRLRSGGTQLGNTQEAIKTQIRKLVKERKADQKAAAIGARRWRMATRNERTLLEEVTGEK